MYAVSKKFYEFNNRVYRESFEFEDAYLNDYNDHNVSKVGHNLNLGIDYSIDDLNTITTSVSYNKGDRIKKYLKKVIAKNIDKEINKKYNLKDKDNGDGEVLEYVLNYNHLFDNKKQKISTDFYYSKSDNSNEIKKWYSNVFPEAEQYINKKSLTKNKNDFFSVSIDYNYEIKKGHNISVGFNSTFRDRKSYYSQFFRNVISNTWQFDNSVSNKFNMNDQIHSAYIEYSDDYKKLNYSIGLRTEYTLYDIKKITSGIKYNSTYLDFFPSLNFSYSISKNDKIRFSYSRRIDRPFLFYYNPFEREYSKDYISKGNPKIKPSYSDNFRISKRISFFSMNFNTTLFYNSLINIINNPSKLDNNGIMFTMPKNNEEIKKIGFNISSMIKIASFWNMNVGGYYSRNYSQTIMPNVSENKSSFNYVMMNCNSRITLWEGVKIQLLISWIAAYNTNISSNNDRYISSFSVSKDLFDKNLRVNFRISDIIPNNENNKYYGLNYYSLSKSDPMDRMFTISLSYNFNKYKRQRVRRPDYDNGSNEI